MNLPQTITVTNKGTITYLYDAAGNTLQKNVKEGSTQKITDYVGGMVFENNALQFVNTEEGRARLNGANWVYDYYLKSHLGNVHALITDDPNQTNKLLEENSYGPWGNVLKSVSYQNTSVPANKYKFTSQLLDDDLGGDTYQMKFRTMDPQIGRFLQIDPLSSDYVYNSTYDYGENKPIVGGI